MIQPFKTKGFDDLFLTFDSADRTSSPPDRYLLLHRTLHLFVNQLLSFQIPFRPSPEGSLLDISAVGGHEWLP